MKNGFVADGHRRFLRGQKALSPESMEMKHAAEFAASSPAQRTQIREQIARNLLRQKNHKPSPATLW
jgi:hypothetical protein